MLKQYTHSNLVIHPGPSDDPDLIVEVTPERAGWELIHFQARRLAGGRSWQFDPVLTRGVLSNTVSCELGIVVLGGRLSVSSNRGHWEDIGERPGVFTGLPYALYLPRGTDFIVTALTDAEFGVAWAPTDRDHPAQLIRPEDVSVEIRGGDNATRQINNLLPPGFDCHRLVIVEVYTPSGGWSSYPPHKHDVHRVGPDGQLLEADLEEIYYYKINPPEGFACQRVYTGETSPLHRAGYPFDALLLARNDDVVLVPEGYHPVTGAPGYTTYYLNVLAGSAQVLTAADDPQYAWVKDSYTTHNPAVPVYDVSRAKARAKP